MTADFTVSNKFIGFVLHYLLTVSARLPEYTGKKPINRKNPLKVQEMKKRRPEILQNARPQSGEASGKHLPALVLSGIMDKESFQKRGASHGGSLSARQYPAADAGAYEGT
ncbi:MAG: hypothetical protein ACLR8P_15420 [Clostridium fessum]